MGKLREGAVVAHPNHFVQPRKYRSAYHVVGLIKFGPIYMSSRFETVSLRCFGTRDEGVACNRGAAERMPRPYHVWLLTPSRPPSHACLSLIQYLFLLAFRRNELSRPLKLCVSPLTSQTRAYKHPRHRLRFAVTTRMALPINQVAPHEPPFLTHALLFGFAPDMSRHAAQFLNPFVQKVLATATGRCLSMGRKVDRLP